MNILITDHVNSIGSVVSEIRSFKFQLIKTHENLTTNDDGHQVMLIAQNTLLALEAMFNI